MSLCVCCLFAFSYKRVNPNELNDSPLRANAFKLEKNILIPPVVAGKLKARTFMLVPPFPLTLAEMNLTHYMIGQ